MADHVSVTFPVDGLEVGGGSDGGVVTTGVEGCNKLVIAEFWSKFNADREPLDEGAEPLPAEAAERTLAVPTIGEGVIAATAAAPVEVATGSGCAAVDFVMGAVAVRGVFPAVSAVVCVTCLASVLDVGAAGGIRDEAAGVLVEAMAGRLVNVRRCVGGMVGSEPEMLGDSIGLVTCVDSVLGGWRMVP